MNTNIEYIDIKSKLKALYEFKVKQDSSLQKINCIANMYNYIVSAQRKDESSDAVDLFLDYIKLARSKDIAMSDYDVEYITDLRERLAVEPNNKLIELCDKLNKKGTNNLYIKEYFIFGESYFYMQDCTMAYTLNERGLYYAIPIIELNKIEYHVVYNSSGIDNDNCIVLDNEFELEKIYLFFVNNHLEQPEKLLSE